MYKINPCVADFTLDQQNICNLCKKKVVDLSKYSETEVAALASNSPDGICGSGPISKMNTAYYLHPFRRFALAVIVVFGSSLFILDAKAQDTIVKLQKDSLNKVQISNKQETAIVGNITDKETGEPIPFANVIMEINGGITGTTSDFDGNFKLKIEDFTESSLNVQFSISFIGYEKYSSSVITITKGKTINIGNIFLDEGARLEGDVIIVGTYHTPLIKVNPDDQRSTTFKRKDIERMPRND